MEKIEFLALRSIVKFMSLLEGKYQEWYEHRVAFETLYGQVTWNNWQPIMPYLKYSYKLPKIGHYLTFNE